MLPADLEFNSETGKYERSRAKEIAAEIVNRKREQEERVARRDEDSEEVKALKSDYLGANASFSLVKWVIGLAVWLVFLLSLAVVVVGLVVSSNEKLDSYYGAEQFVEKSYSVLLAEMTGQSEITELKVESPTLSAEEQEFAQLNRELAKFLDSPMTKIMALFMLMMSMFMGIIKQDVVGALGGLLAAMVLINAPHIVGALDPNFAAQTEGTSVDSALSAESAKTVILARAIRENDYGMISQFMVMNEAEDILPHEHVFLYAGAIKAKIEGQQAIVEEPAPTSTPDWEGMLVQNAQQKNDENVYNEYAQCVDAKITAVKEKVGLVIGFLALFMMVLSARRSSRKEALIRVIGQKAFQAEFRG